MKIHFAIIDDDRFPHWPTVEKSTESLIAALAPFEVDCQISTPRVCDWSKTSEGNIQHRSNVTIYCKRNQKQGIIRAVNEAIRPPVYEFSH